MREIIMLDYDEIHSAWDMYKAFKGNYGIFLDKKKKVLLSLIRSQYINLRKILIVMRI